MSFLGGSSKTTSTYDERKIFDGGGSDYAENTGQINITDGSSEAFSLGNDAVKAAAAAVTDSLDTVRQINNSNNDYLAEFTGAGFEFAADSQAAAFDLGHSSLGFASENSGRLADSYESTLQTLTDFSKAQDDALSSTLSTFAESSINVATGGISQNMKYILIAAVLMVGMTAFFSAKG